jgi:hypothetical protein
VCLYLLEEAEAPHEHGGGVCGGLRGGGGALVRMQLMGKGRSRRTPLMSC